jgi:hypothetical protein
MYKIDDSNYKYNPSRVVATKNCIGPHSSADECGIRAIKHHKIDALMDIVYTESDLSSHRLLREAIANKNWPAMIFLRTFYNIDVSDYEWQREVSRTGDYRFLKEFLHSIGERNIYSEILYRAVESHSIGFFRYILNNLLPADYIEYIKNSELLRTAIAINDINFVKEILNIAPNNYIWNFYDILPYQDNEIKKHPSNIINSDFEKTNFHTEKKRDTNGNPRELYLRKERYN